MVLLIFLNFLMLLLKMFVRFSLSVEVLTAMEELTKYFYC
jgi:hypothetical protein